MNRFLTKLILITLAAWFVAGSIRVHVTLEQVEPADPDYSDYVLS